MPVTRERKQELVQAYRQWLEGSSGVVLTSYSGMSVRALEDLRRKVREAGGEDHAIKNRLMGLGRGRGGREGRSRALGGSTGIGFGGEAVAGMVKAIVETARQSEALKVKAALLEGRIYDARQVERLAELPPLPVMRAQLLGLLQTPATRVAGVVAGSVRQIVNVVKAYSETQPAGV